MEANSQGPPLPAPAPAKPYVFVRVSSSDGTVFQIQKKSAEVSTLLKDLMEDLGEDSLQGPIPLPNVESRTLYKVLVWCEFNKDAPPPEPDYEYPWQSRPPVYISDWNMRYIRSMNRDQEILTDLLLAANYLDIKGLVDLVSLEFASMIAGKTPGQIRKTFNIQNDFTKAETSQLYRDTAWVTDPFTNTSVVTITKTGLNNHSAS